jgi:hypothetical protein
MRIATGEIEERIESSPPDKAAITASEMGKRGGKARAQKLTQTQRIAIARKAARKRWGEERTADFRTDTRARDREQAERWAEGSQARRRLGLHQVAFCFARRRRMYSAITAL